MTPLTVEEIRKILLDARRIAKFIRKREVFFSYSVEGLTIIEAARRIMSTQRKEK